MIAEDESTEAQLWMGAYCAAYAILLFKRDGASAKSIDPIAEEHANWVIKKLKERADAVKKEKRLPCGHVVDSGMCDVRCADKKRKR